MGSKAKAFDPDAYIESKSKVGFDPDAYIAKKASLDEGASSAPVPDTSIMEKLASAAEGAGNSLSFGGLPYLKAGLSKAVGTVTPASPQQVLATIDAPIGDVLSGKAYGGLPKEDASFNDLLASTEANRAALKAQSPGSYLAGGLAGSVAAGKALSAGLSKLPIGKTEIFDPFIKETVLKDAPGLDKEALKQAALFAAKVGKAATSPFETAISALSGESSLPDFGAIPDIASKAAATLGRGAAKALPVAEGTGMAGMAAGDFMKKVTAEPPVPTPGAKLLDLSSYEQASTDPVPPDMVPMIQDEVKKSALTNTEKAKVLMGLQKNGMVSRQVLEHLQK